MDKVFRKVAALLVIVSFAGVPTFSQAWTAITGGLSCSRTAKHCCCKKEASDDHTSVRAPKHCTGKCDSVPPLASIVFAPGSARSGESFETSGSVARLPEFAAPPAEHYPNLYQRPPPFTL